MYEQVCMRAGVLGRQKRVESCADAVVVSYPTGVLGTELGSIYKNSTCS